MHGGAPPDKLAKIKAQLSATAAKKAKAAKKKKQEAAAKKKKPIVASHTVTDQFESWHESGETEPELPSLDQKPVVAKPTAEIPPTSRNKLEVQQNNVLRGGWAVPTGGLRGGGSGAMWATETATTSPQEQTKWVKGASSERVQFVDRQITKPMESLSLDDSSFYHQRKHPDSTSHRAQREEAYHGGVSPGGREDQDFDGLDDSNKRLDCKVLDEGDDLSDCSDTYIPISSQTASKVLKDHLKSKAKESPTWQMTKGILKGVKLRAKKGVKGMWKELKGGSKFFLLCCNETRFD